MADVKLTKDQRRLLYLIGVYANEADVEAVAGDTEFWLKDSPLLAAIYELTVAGVFETYDYAAMSVLCVDGFRRFLNVSREGLEDLNVLMEKGLLAHLKLGSSQYGTVSAYRLTDEGMEVYRGIPVEEREAVDRVIRCPHCKDQLLQIDMVKFERFLFRCRSCGYERETGVFDIEDVSYKSSPRFIKLPYHLVEGG